MGSFSDALKAEVYVRDRATCAYTGKSLWMLDDAFSSLTFYDQDWADHIRPISKGGANELSNLVCASAASNYARSNSSTANLYLFRNGRPTENFWWHYGMPSLEVVRRLKRNESLTNSDWYLNRAMTLVMNFVLDKWHGSLRTSKRKKRYWCRAAFRKLRDWQRLSKSDRKLEKRGLVEEPRWKVTRLLLELRGVKTERDVYKVADVLFVYFKISADYLKEMLAAESPDDRFAVASRAKRNSKVHPRMKILFRAMATGFDHVRGHLEGED